MRERADGFTPAGGLRTSINARGVDTLTTRLQFTKGFERTEANGFDTDTTNDWDRIVSVAVRARMRVERVDRAVYGGAPVWRDYEWRVTPRNLILERNRVLSRVQKNAAGLPRSRRYQGGSATSTSASFASSWRHTSSHTRSNRSSSTALRTLPTVTQTTCSGAHAAQAAGRSPRPS